jgi:uncharacterized membrane protein
MDRNGFQSQMNHPYWEHAGHGHPVARLLLLLLLVLAVAAVAIAVYRYATRGRGQAAQLLPAQGAPAEEALGIVRLRYARGEINRDDYVRMSADFGKPVEASGTAEPSAPTA